MSTDDESFERVAEEHRRFGSLTGEEFARERERRMAAMQAAADARDGGGPLRPGDVSSVKGRLPVISRVVERRLPDGTVVPGQEPPTWDPDEIYEYDAQGRRAGPADAPRTEEEARQAAHRVPGHRVDVATRVRELAQEARWQVAAGEGGTVLTGATGASWTVTQEDGRWVVRTADQEVPLLTSSSPHAADVLLADVVGAAWRYGRGLPPLDVVARGVPLPGARVGTAADGSWTLRWDDRHEATTPSERVAAVVLRGLAHGVVDVVASYRDPDGRPVFPPTATPEDGPAA